MAATETLSRRRELEEEEGPLAKKIKISDLPVSASKRVAMDALVQTFKKKGAFDDLRKKVWAEFESSEAKQQFLSALPPILDRKIDADQSILSSDRGKATMLVEGEVDRSSVYKAVEESLSALIESHAPSAITEIRTFRAAEIGAEAAAEESQLGQKTEDEYRSETLQRLDIRQKAREVEFAKKRELEREEARKRRAEADRVKREEEELKQKQQEEQKKADRERREREDDVYARNRKRIRDADHDPAQDRDRDRRSYRDSEPRKDRHYRDMDRNRSRDRDRKVSPIARSQPRRSFSSSTKPSIIAATLTPEVNKSLEDEALTMLLKESQQRPGANTTSRHSAQAHDFDSRRPAKSLLSDTKGSRRESIQLRTTLDQASRVSDKTPRTPSGRDKQSRDVSRSPAASGAKKDRYKDQDRDRERDQKRDRDRDREKDRDRDREGYRERDRDRRGDRPTRHRRSRSRSLSRPRHRHRSPSRSHSLRRKAHNRSRSPISRRRRSRSPASSPPVRRHRGRDRSPADIDRWMPPSPGKRDGRASRDRSLGRDREKKRNRSRSRSRSPRRGDRDRERDRDRNDERERIRRERRDRDRDEEDEERNRERRRRRQKEREDRSRERSRDMEQRRRRRDHSR